MGKSIFVTVGTTQFDALCRAIQSEEFQARATQLGYTKIILQYGRAFPPPPLSDEEKVGERRGEERKGEKIVWETFDFTDQMARYVARADVVISHCGSGTVLDTLRGPIFEEGVQSVKRPVLILVPNPLLMDNHQGELAEALVGAGVALLSTADTHSILDKLAQATAIVATSSTEPSTTQVNALPVPAIGQLNELIRRTIGA